LLDKLFMLNIFLHSKIIKITHSICFIVLIIKLRILILLKALYAIKVSSFRIYLS